MTSVNLLKMKKKIKKMQQLKFNQMMPGFRATGVMHAEFDTDPFLIFGEFYNDRSVFGPHPHASVSVMTYLLPDSKGSFLNRDSFGDHSIIHPGGIHVTQTGKGIYNDEFPEEREAIVSGRREVPTRWGWYWA